jgi:hypothetical protein
MAHAILESIDEPKQTLGSLGIPYQLLPNHTAQLVGLHKEWREK